MFTHRLVLGAAVVGLLSCLYASSLARTSAAEHASPGVALRAGVFDRQKLLVAYYHSQIHEKTLAVLQADLKKARDEGDDAAARKIEAQGEALQDLAHRQLAGQATLANVMEPLRPYFAEVAKACGVALIVETPLYRDDTVELVDVTAKLVEKLPPVGR